MPLISQTFDLALAQHQAGNLQGAEVLYRQILQADPQHADAWHLLGVIAHQVGKHGLAIQTIGRAIVLNPRSPHYYSNLGEAQRALNQFEAALDSYRRAIELEPNFVEAYSNLGIVLYSLERPEEARAAYREALRHRPDFAEAHNNLGNTFKDEGRLEEAMAEYRQAIALKPGFATAYNNMGNAFADAGAREDAKKWYAEAMRIQPNFAEPHYNLGNVLKDESRLHEAQAEYREAMRLKSTYAEAHNNLANSLQVQGELDDAVCLYHEALRLKPRYAQARSNLLFCLNYHPEVNGPTLFAEHRRFGEEYDLPLSGHVQFPHVPDPHRKLRIGYVSPDFRRHPVASFFEPVLVHHDPQQFETYLYAEVAVPDATTERFKRFATVWRNTSKITDAELLRQVRADRIDLLVDLAGHTSSNRLPLFGHKPAPVQISYLGYPNTTGMGTIDYRLTDGVVDPPGEPVRHTEELVRLDGCLCCFLPPNDAPPPSSAPALATGKITFGSLHSLAKLNHRVVDLWCRVLEAMPAARLLVIRDTLEGATRERFRQRFAERGFHEDRVELRNALPAQGSHLSLYDEIDVSLDTFPWCGHTTACESLWMGVPIVTLYGDRHAGRLVASVLTRLGRPDWIAHSPDEYVELATHLAGDLAALSRLRAELREEMRASPLCAAEPFTRGLEGVYRALWRRWCAAL